MNKVIYSRRIILIFFAIFFSTTMSSYYFPQLRNLRLLEFVGLFLLMTFKLRKTNDYSSYLIVFFNFFLVCTILSMFISFLNNVENFHAISFFGVFFSLFFSYLFFNLFENNVSSLVKVVDYTNKVHVLFFMIQLISFYVFGTYIDLIEPITGEAQRNIGGLFDGVNSIRPSGLFGEPAAYCLAIIGFNFILLVKRKKIGAFSMFSLVTILLTMSALGVVYVVGFILVHIFFINKKIKSILILFIFFSASFFIVLKYELLNYIYLIDKLSTFTESTSYQYRIGNITNDMSNLPLFKLLFGVGLGNLDTRYNIGSTLSLILIEQGIILGSVFFLAIFALLKRFKVKYYNIFFLFFLMVGTHTFSHVEFWILLMSVCIISKNQFYENAYNFKFDVY